MSSRSRRASEPVTREGNPLYSGEYTYDDWIREDDELRRARRKKISATPSEGYMELREFMLQSLKEYDPDAYGRLCSLFDRALGMVEGPTSWPRWKMLKDPGRRLDMGVGKYYMDYYGRTDDEIAEQFRAELQEVRDQYDELDTMRPEVEGLIAELPDFYDNYLEYGRAVYGDEPDSSEDTLNTFILERTARALTLKKQAESPGAIISTDWRDDLRDYAEDLRIMVGDLREVQRYGQRYEDLEAAGYGPVLEALGRELPQDIGPRCPEIMLKDAQRATVGRAAAELIDTLGLEASDVSDPLDEGLMGRIREFVPEYAERIRAERAGERNPLKDDRLTVSEYLAANGLEGVPPVRTPMNPITGRRESMLAVDNVSRTVARHPDQRSLEEFSKPPTMILDYGKINFNNAKGLNIPTTIRFPVGPGEYGGPVKLNKRYESLMTYIANRMRLDRGPDWMKPDGEPLFISIPTLIKGWMADEDVNVQSLKGEVERMIDTLSSGRITMDLTQLIYSNDELKDAFRAAGWTGYRIHEPLLNVSHKDELIDAQGNTIVWIKIPEIPALNKFGMLTGQFTIYDEALIETNTLKIAEMKNPVARSIAENKEYRLEGTGKFAGTLHLEQNTMNRAIKEWVLTEMEAKRRMQRARSKTGPIFLDLDDAIDSLYDEKPTKDQRKRLRRNIEIYMAILCEEGHIAYFRQEKKRAGNGWEVPRGWTVYLDEGALDGPGRAEVERIKGGGKAERYVPAVLDLGDE